MIRESSLVTTQWLLTCPGMASIGELLWSVYRVLSMFLVSFLVPLMPSRCAARTEFSAVIVILFCLWICGLL